MPPLRVLIAEDHRLVRAGLRKLLESLSGVEVVGEAGDGRDALAQVEAKSPDIALLDIAMPGLNGLEAAERIVAEHPGTRVLLLSMHSNEEYVLQALRAGVSGYILKDSALTELELAIQAVRRGDTYLSPAVSRHVGDYVRRSGGEPTPREGLTSRQREVLQLIAEGESTKQIAGKLGVSVKTIETHRSQLMNKLDIHDVAGLVRYAIRIGLVTPEK
ncbi:MAG TPA: response regulator transcription factor [Thermoanaerobaculia bacterium]|jgi:DNA-binding NarL/FixJ family response regulator|nr:response regulator transcription factor [Thermoanaerobaculia bacterium]